MSLGLWSVRFSSACERLYPFIELMRLEFLNSRVGLTGKEQAELKACYDSRAGVRFFLMAIGWIVLVVTIVGVLYLAAGIQKEEGAQKIIGGSLLMITMLGGEILGVNLILNGYNISTKKVEVRLRPDETEAEMMQAIKLRQLAESEAALKVVAPILIQRRMEIGRLADEERKQYVEERRDLIFASSKQIEAWRENGFDVAAEVEKHRAKGVLSKNVDFDLAAMHVAVQDTIEELWLDLITARALLKTGVAESDRQVDEAVRKMDATDRIKLARMKGVAKLAEEGEKMKADARERYAKDNPALANAICDKIDRMLAEASLL